MPIAPESLQTQPSPGQRQAAIPRERDDGERETPIVEDLTPLLVAQDSDVRELRHRSLPPRPTARPPRLMAPTTPPPLPPTVPPPPEERARVAQLAPPPSWPRRACPCCSPSLRPSRKSHFRWWLLTRPGFRHGSGPACSSSASSLWRYSSAFAHSVRSNGPARPRTRGGDEKDNGRPRCTDACEDVDRTTLKERHAEGSASQSRP
jgi:hypothetical protein